MFGDVWSWAGSPRKTGKNIGIDPQRIHIQLGSRLRDAQYWTQIGSFSPDEIAVRLHHGLVAIHPFPNGNGRHARLMADLLIAQLGHCRAHHDRHPAPGLAELDVAQRMVLRYIRPDMTTVEVAIVAANRPKPMFMPPCWSSIADPFTLLRAQRQNQAGSGKFRTDSTDRRSALAFNPQACRGSGSRVVHRPRIPWQDQAGSCACLPAREPCVPVPRRGPWPVL